MILRRKLETEMDRVNTSILHMGTLVEEALYKALAALSRGDKLMAREVIEADQKIDDEQARIEEHVTRIIAMEQPVAQDLRLLISSIKLVADIERIGDYARHIAKAVQKISRPGIEQVLEKILTMGELGIGMLHDILSAFMDGDLELARSVARQDDRMDELHERVYNEVIHWMQKDAAHIPDGTGLLMLCRFLERLGDHVTNMCEWVVYAQSGQHVELNA